MRSPSTADAKLLADIKADLDMRAEDGVVNLSNGVWMRLCEAVKGESSPRYVSTPPTTPPTEGDEKILRRMTKHEAIHELEGQCCVIARACCSLTNLDALTLAGFAIPETEGIMKLAEAVIERAKALHDAEFISNGD